MALPAAPTYLSLSQDKLVPALDTGHPAAAAAVAAGPMPPMQQKVVDDLHPLRSLLPSAAAGQVSSDRAAGGTTEMANNITGVSTAAESTAQALGQTRTTVSRFTY